MDAFRPALITERGTPADLDDSTAYTLCMNNVCSGGRNQGSFAIFALPLSLALSSPFSPHS